MKSAQLSDGSIHNYLGAIRGRLTTWAHVHGITSKQIEGIVDVSEFAAIADELRETPEFKMWNKQGHGMYAAALNNYRSFLDAVGATASGEPAEYGPSHQQLEKIGKALDEPFDPKDQIDARERVLREVVQRLGQRKFRNSLITAYSGRCAISGCPVQPLLEAAHITPYLGPETNAITNGLLLRADLHTLWDLGLLAVNPTSQKIWISPKVEDQTYQQLSGASLTSPIHPSLHPSPAALQEQWAFANSKNNASLAA
ncbi:MAG TPA: HNH endonuclease signature motif containing protein [Telluria sp.]|nr:HNH endonuclease signature motif containing protein [Telluria sp.]